MKELRVNDCVKGIEEACLDIDVEAEGKEYTLCIKGDLYLLEEVHQGNWFTPGYRELKGVEAVVSEFNIYDKDGMEIPQFNTPFNQDGKYVEDLLIKHCFEG